jgi:methylase of polypeptide subunit release factors
MPAPASPDEIREVNTRYHDGAAAGYDSKWGIDFGAVGQAQVLGKVHKLLPAAARFGRALEIGAGTGYFSLNLLQAGVIERSTCTDISPGMLAALRANAERLGLDVTFVQGDLLAGVEGFDAVVSNPPYVGEGERVMPEVLHEPHAAVFGGLAVIERLVPAAAGARFIALEHGLGQAEAVEAILRAAGFTSTSRVRDLAGIERVLVGRR